ncbi:MAG: hypothetical protein WKF96_09680 [Solirubrobacteraceae bacterium]
MIPDATSPGRYLVALYDGEEGGAHYTWASYQVTAGAASGASPRDDDANETPTLAIWIAAAAGLIGGFAASVVLTRRRGRFAER